MPRALCVITFSVYPLISETQKIGSGRLSKFMEPQFRSFSVSSPLTLPGVLSQLQDNYTGNQPLK